MLPALRWPSRQTKDDTLPPLTHAAYLARGYMPELDGLRALSILGVITAHMHTDIWDWLAGGRGVFIFFVLSGYLITRLCLLEEGKRGGVSFSAFYLRRAFRLLPAYYLVVAAHVVLIVVLGFSPEKRDLLVSALPYFLLYMSDIPGLLGINGQIADIPFGHGWSLGIEEKFYLVFPALIFGVLKMASQARVPVTIGLTLFFMATPFFGMGNVSSLLFPYCNILLGCLLAMLLHEEKWFNQFKKLGNWWTLNILVLIFLALQLGFHGDQADPLAALSARTTLVRSVYAIAVTSLLAAILMSDNWLKAGLGWAPLVFIGKISYGIYLIHRLCLNPVEDFLGAGGGDVAVNAAAFVLASVASIIAAYMMYLVFEGPLNRFGHAWSRRIQNPSRTISEARTSPEPA